MTELDSSEHYNNDIELVMDFMKLSLLFDNSTKNPSNLKEITKLQKDILELLPVAQSNRMSAVYDLLADIYRRNMNELDGKILDKPEQKIFSKQQKQQNKRNTHFMILFYKSSCATCQSILPFWEEFKRQNSMANFTCLEYDKDDDSNKEIFTRFKIENVPSVVKLRLDRNTSDYSEKLTSSINLENLLKFTLF